MGYLQNFKFDFEGLEGAPVLVFLHGVMGSGANWRKITPHFKNNFKILTFDQRGHGWSFKPAKGYGPEDYSNDLLQILNELKIDKIHLVGHSMGGRNALQFAHSYPDRVHSLVIEDIGPEGNPQAMERTLRLLELVPTPFSSKSQAKVFFENEFPLKIQNHPQKSILGSYFFMNIEEKPDGSADWRFHKEGILMSLKSGHFKPRWDQVRDLKCPTLFIRGANSDDLTQSELLKVKQVNPQIETIEIQNAGHWVHFDQPAEFARVLADFLSRVKN